MSPLAIVIVGLIATGYMFAANALVERLNVVRGSMLEAVGAFAIPEQVRSRSVQVALHALAGVAFTAVYAYVFNFVKPESIRGYMELGGLIGLVHGFFVSFFTVMGFSSVHDGQGVRRFTATSAVLNVIFHMLFGFTVGLGLGLAVTRDALWLFAGYAALLGVGAGSLLLTLLPPRRLRTVSAPRGRQ